MSDLGNLNVPVEISIGFHVENYATTLGKRNAAALTH